MSVADSFQAMDYGPAPEDASFVHEWLEARRQSLGFYIDGEMVSAKGRKVLASHNPASEAFLADIPAALVTVDLPEGVRLLAPLKGDGAADLAVGAPVALGIEFLEDGLAVPTCRLAA